MERHSSYTITRKWFIIECMHNFCKLFVDPSIPIYEKALIAFLAPVFLLLILYTSTIGWGSYRLQLIFEAFESVR